MKCATCQQPIAKHDPTVTEVGYDGKVKIVCVSCWHKEMKHKASEIPEK